MTIQKISKILDYHGVPFFVKDNRIYADSMICGTKLFEETVDVTEYTLKDLAIWLGY
jgi:hypothetical protein